MGNKISTMSNGFDVYQRTRGKNTTYRTVDPKTNLTHTRLDSRDNDNKIMIKSLSGRKGSPTKAHQFYNHLINKHNKELATDKQSPGGFATWKAMAKDNKDVEIHKHNIETGKIQPVASLDNPEDHHSKNIADPKAMDLLIAKKRKI